MENKSSNILDRIIEKAKREHRSVNIYAHEIPDGDAISSSKVLEQILNSMGIEARYIVTSPRINNRYSNVIGETLCFKGRVNRNDISVILDTSTANHVENKLFNYSSTGNTFVIDHHEKNPKVLNIEDELELPPENVYRNPEASSTCEILTHLLKDNGLLNSDYATKLLVGQWTDTSKFRNLKQDTLNTLLTLLNYGADFEKVRSCLESKRFLQPEVGLAKAFLHTKKIKIGNTYLNYLGLDNKTVRQLEEKYRTKFIQKKIFKLMDTENTSLAVAITENIPDNFFCEFRSSKDIGNVDVFSVATSFGGGGHYNASGCTVKSNQGIDKVSREVLSKVTDRGLPNLVGINPFTYSEEDLSLKEILDSMDRFNTGLTKENFSKIEELIQKGAKHQSVYDEKISFEKFMVRNSLLAQIPDEQLRNRRISFRLNKAFLEKMKSEYGFETNEVLNEIELFKELDVDYVSIITPEGKGASIDSKGNIKKYQRKDIQK